MLVDINEIGEIYLNQLIDATIKNTWVDWPKSRFRLPFTKYTIKESDWRVKTATITSPQYVDLTQGQNIVLIKSEYHENFAGVILDVEYDEDKELYTYQCQDWSRLYMGMLDGSISNTTVYNYLRFLIARGELGLNPKQKEIDSLNVTLSGLRAKGKYDQSLYKGNIYAGNPMTSNISMVLRGKTFIDAIRELVFTRTGFFDVWFNDKGVIQIEPLSKTDWETTGLHLVDSEILKRKYKFSTTNAITSVMVEGDGTGKGKAYKSFDLTGLSLSAFFGNVSASISNPVKSSATKTTSNSSPSNKKNTVTGKNGNPFNNKPKRIIVSADGGSGDFRASIINLLKKDGWSVTDLGVGPGTHSRSYEILDSKYAVNLTIYNGMCAGTIKECYDGWLKGKHEKYGVALVMMWDTHNWTSKKGKNNPKGDWYHRNGDMSDYYLAEAWDWQNGGNPTIPDVAAYFKKYKILYCCGTTPSAAYAQFKAGGYARMKGLY